MKITLAQLLPHLEQNLAPLYLVSGDEPLLVDSARNTIYQYAHLKDFTHREYLQADTGFDWSHFVLLAYNSSLFATQQIVELRLPHAQPGDVGSKVLIEYAQTPPTDKILILITPKLDAAMQKSKWFKAIEQHGVVIQIWPLERVQLLSWIANKAQQVGINISDNGIKLIADYTAGNLIATAQEIEKLSLLYSHGVAVGETGCGAAAARHSNHVSCVSDEQVIAALSDNAHFTIFDLIDAFYTQNKAQLMSVFQHLQSEGIEPILVLWVIARELRLLINLKNIAADVGLLQQQLNYNHSHKIKNENKTLIKRMLPKLSMSKLENMLRDAAVVDQIIKGIKVGDAWRELQRILLFDR